ncbi:copper chaperone PCu(A)C [Histidinibacterium aquaticum]|uniref:Copper chaperone PCu(A)C n=1 Tax=Histidinibacterium aquaticum TaxID=2613962 RepID=A0A5J5GBG1_9RHOB|nr:copper chaperone PCu(A)C [Histidinibacterium aquaticum]KAA9005280.1 copper chaperone PCu(A)C [Histidinibacterium aquaticum]
MKYLALAALLVPAAAFAQEDEDHVAERDGLRILHAWTTATERGPAQVYMLIENETGETVVLTGARVGEAEAALMAGQLSGGGDAEILPMMEVAADSDFDLAPGEVYLELDELPAPLAEGDHLEMELRFDGIEPLDVEVEVFEDGTLEHPHAGHAH